MPVEDDLTSGSTVLCSKVNDCLLFEYIEVLVLIFLHGPTEGTKGSIGCDVDSKFILELYKVILYKIRVEFDLIDNWLDLAVSEDIKQHWDSAVADPNASY